jgi:hypothetical protein
MACHCKFPDRDQILDFLLKQDSKTLEMLAKKNEYCWRDIAFGLVNKFNDNLLYQDNGTRQFYGHHPDDVYNTIKRRIPELRSKNGYRVCDIDNIFFNDQLRTAQLIEIKCFCGEPTQSQLEILRRLDKAVRLWSKQEEFEFLGTHIVQFENVSEFSGRVWVNGTEVSGKEMHEILSGYRRMPSYFENPDIKVVRVEDEAFGSDLVIKGEINN